MCRSKKKIQKTDAESIPAKGDGVNSSAFAIPNKGKFKTMYKKM